MSLLQSIQSKLPRPEHRSRPEIDRDLEDEFAFHLEMRTRAIEAEEGVDHQAARGLAHERFGNIERIRKDCQRIALKERIMLQRVNFVMMIVVLLIVVVVGIQVMITQRYNTLALQAITADLANMKFEAQAAARDDGDGSHADTKVAHLVYLDGDVLRPGVYSLPTVGILTADRLITASGGITGASEVSIKVQGFDGKGRPTDRFLAINRWSESDTRNVQYPLQPGDRVTVQALPSRAPISTQPAPNDAQAQAVGDFVVRLFALADPRDENLDQTIRDFLDAEEESLDEKYADDPATAGMIRELIAARRKIFDTDANALRAADAEARAKAVTDFLKQSLTAADAHGTAEVAVQEVLDHAASQVDVQFADDPETAARIRTALTAASWNAQADDGSATPDAPLSEEQLKNFISRLMVASIPNADPANLPSRDELARAEQAIAERYANDPTLLNKLNGMIATVRDRLDEIEGASTRPTATASAPAAGEGDAADLPGVDRSLEVSPFTAVRWKDEWTPIVQYAGQWFELRSVGGYHVNQLVSEIRSRHGDALARQRFSEDLLQMLEEISRGAHRNANLRLQLVDLKSGSLIAVNQAPVSAENRAAIVNINAAAREGGDDYPKWPIE